MNNLVRARRRFSVVTLAVLSTFSLLSFGYVGAQSGSGIQLAVDTANTDQDGVLSIFGGVRLGGEIGLPVAAGDINGDGMADVAFCEMYATTGAGLSRNNGQVNIYLSDGRDTGTTEASQSPSNISTISGRSAGDLLGSAVAIGDVNGDGFGDVVVSASLNDGPDGSRFNAGAVYVIPGSANFNLHADLSTTGGATPPNGISVIYGPQVNGRFGVWVETGDVDGDGIPDIVVGADQLNSDNGALQQIGGAYIIFGAKDLPQVIDLKSPPAGVRITRILGANAGDHWGAALSIGDVNGDGISDVVISAAIDRDSASFVTPQDQSSGIAEAAASDGGLRPACGEVYVLYGSKTWPSHIDLSSPPAESTHLIGAHSADFFGSQVFSADLNGDGKRDLVIGSLQALSPDAHGRTGAVYIVYGSAEPSSLQGATIDMLNPPSAFQISVIYGENSLDCAGDSVRAYDINNDGMAELFIGSPENDVTVDGEDRDDAGTTDIIFGRPDFLPPVVKLYDLPPGFNVYRMAGAHGNHQGLNGGDEFSYRLAGADVDGDGYVDYIANAMKGDGINNSLVDAGDVYVFSGKKLSEKLGFLNTQPAAPVLKSAMLSDFSGNVVQQAAAGQNGLVITVIGTGLSSTSFQLLVNGNPVTSSPPVDQPFPGMLEELIRLDLNPAVKNSVGPLVVTAQNLNPQSRISNAITAGTLTGPQITSIDPKVKPSGKVILQISGVGFQSDFVASVTDLNGTAIPVKVSNVISSSSMKAKIVGQSFASGIMLRVRVGIPSGVQSNEVNVTVP